SAGSSSSSRRRATSGSSTSTTSSRRSRCRGRPPPSARPKARTSPSRRRPPLPPRRRARPARSRAPGEAAMADVSAIVGNYNTGAYLTPLVAGLRRETITRRDGRRGSLEIVVVDNASPSDQSAWLDPLERDGVKVVRAQENLGYAGGNNLGVRHATGDKIL